MIQKTNTKNKNTYTMKNSILVMTMLIFLLGIVNADSMRMIVVNPQASFEGTVGDSIGYTIGATNKNEFDINVSFGEPDNAKILYDGETAFQLKTNETILLNYTLTFTEAGNITTSIPVFFQSGEQSFTLQQILFLKVNVVEQEAVSTSSNSKKTKDVVKFDVNINDVDSTSDVGNAIDTVDTVDTYAIDESNEDVMLGNSDFTPNATNVWLYVSIGIIFILICSYIFVRYKKHQALQGEEKQIEEKIE
jgi:uncharacterized membrane protein YjfL (UPF0719 family)